MEQNAKIYIAGHNGLAGSAILRRLQSLGYDNLLTISSKELDLRRQQDVEAFFEKEKPEYVFIAAAKVGGIAANNRFPAEFLYDNLMIESNIIHSSYLKKVKKLLFLGSSCIYPKLAPQPMKEEYLLTGRLERTNEAYAIAKITGIELCKFYRRQFNCDFISCMPTNLYGPGDNFDLYSSHVMPALIRKFYEAKTQNAESVTVWGSGRPKREFLYVDDLADACVFLMNEYSDSTHINIGTGIEITIGSLARMIADIAGYNGKIVFERSKPDGTPQKLLDLTKLHSLGWQHKTELTLGVKKVYEWYEKCIEKD